jgi:hypothetical protein
VLYTGYSRRPNALMVRVRIDGVKQSDRRFLNEAP